MEEEEKKERASAPEIEDAAQAVPVLNGESGDNAAPESGDGAPREEERVTAESLKYKNGKEVAKSGVLGVFIGLAVIVPGISGSTVAIIFKLYRKLLFAIGSIFKKFKKCAFSLVFWADLY